MNRLGARSGTFDGHAPAEFRQRMAHTGRRVIIQPLPQLRAQRPDGGALFAMLYAVDNSGNACPSLHVAAAVLSGLWLHRVLRQIGAPRWAMLAAA